MIRDLAFYMLALFMFAATLLAAYIALDNINVAYQDMPELNADGKALMTGFTNRYDNVFDYAFLTVLIGALVGTLALVWYLDIVPLLFFAILFVVVVIASVAGYMANAWAGMLEDSTLAAAASNFPITNFLITNYMVVIGLYGFLMLIVFFMKPGGVAE